MNKLQQRFIELCLKYEALKFGGLFTLKSGRKSPYFFNAGLFNSGNVLAEIGDMYAETIIQHDLQFDMLFGPAYKGIPLVTAAAISLAKKFNLDIPYAFNRKETKDHGEGGNIVGAPIKGKVLIIDDVMTAGTATREAIEIIKSNNATPVGIVIALDRQERGQGSQSAVQEVQEEFKIPVICVAKLEDLITFISQSELLKTHLPAMQAYRDEYGV